MRPGAGRERLLTRTSDAEWHRNEGMRGLSHYTRVRTKFTDAGLLTEALSDLGFKVVEVHGSPEPLVGYRGDERQQRAEIIIRRRHVGFASNDIGFARQPDGTYEAIVSEFDRAKKYGASWLATLARAYAHRAVSSFATEGGFDLVESTTAANGEVRMVLRRA